MKEKKIIISFFGVVSRSIRYTHKSIKENLIDILIKNGYSVDIYVFNNNVEKCKVDKCFTNNNDYKLLNPTFFEEITQKRLDNKIKKTIQSKEIRTKMSYYKHAKNYKQIVQNCLRQMYSEEMVGNFLEANKNKYDLSIVCGPDFYLIQPINIIELEDSFTKTDTIYTTDCNDGLGYTNGFYFGCLDPMIKVLKRFSILHELFPTKYDYEYLLKQGFVLNNITRCISSMEFIKIRNNKMIQPQGRLLTKFKQKDENFLKIMKKIKNKINK